MSALPSSYRMWMSVRERKSNRAVTNSMYSFPAFCHSALTACFSFCLLSSMFFPFCSFQSWNLLFSPLLFPSTEVRYSLGKSKLCIHYSVKSQISRKRANAYAIYHVSGTKNPTTLDLVFLIIIHYTNMYAGEKVLRGLEWWGFICLQHLKL